MTPMSVGRVAVSVAVPVGRVFRPGALLLTALLTGCVTAAPGPVVTAPRFPDYPVPDIPVSLKAETDIVERHEAGWRRLQAGDLRGA